MIFLDKNRKFSNFFLFFFRYIFQCKKWFFWKILNFWKKIQFFCRYFFFWFKFRCKIWIFEIFRKNNFTFFFIFSNFFFWQGNRFIFWNFLYIFEYVLMWKSIWKWCQIDLKVYKVSKNFASGGVPPRPGGPTWIPQPPPDGCLLGKF